MTIRLATPEDIAAVMELLLSFHAECGIAPINLNKVVKDVVSLIANLDLFVAEEDEGLVGLLGIRDTELPYGDHHVLGDVYFFVAPEHRGGNVGKALMQAATLEAERRELPLFIRVTNPDRAKRRGRIGEVAGFFPAGYVLRLR